MEEEGKTCPGNTSRCTGWWPGQSEAFLQRQGWMSGQTNFFKVNCWPSSENMKVESGKYPYQIQQATGMLATRGIRDDEGRQQESQAPWSSSLPPHRRPHHHQVSRWDSPADVYPGYPGVHGGLEHLGGTRVHPPPRVSPASPGKASSAGPRSRSRCAGRCPAGQTSELPTVHYGLTGGWVQNFKPSYLPCFLQCAMVDQALG